MAFDNRDIKPRKKSYYPFSKNYPGRRSGTSYAIGESRTRKKKEKRKKIFFSVFLVFFFVLVFIIAAVSINLSKKPYEHELTGVPAEYDGKLRALYMPDDVLDGGIAFDLFKTELTETKANAVVIDFKTKDGYLNYVSSVGTANDIGASSKAYQNAFATIDRLKSAGYKIIARIYCYEDSVAASHLGAAAAVTNSDGTLWLDNSAQHDGEPWLNPYSPVAEKYLLSIVSEISSLGVDAVILDSVEFPESIYLDKAVFSGEEKSIESRNAVLHSFIEKVKNVLGDKPLCVMLSAADALGGNTARYDGSLFDSAADFVAVDFRKSAQRDGFAYGEKTYSAETTDEKALVTDCIPLLSSKLDENYQTGGFIPVIDDSSIISELDSRNVNNYVLFVEG